MDGDSHSRTLSLGHAARWNKCTLIRLRSRSTTVDAALGGWNNRFRLGKWRDFGGCLSTHAGAESDEGFAVSASNLYRRRQRVFRLGAAEHVSHYPR